MSKLLSDAFFQDSYKGLFFKILSLVLTIINVRLMVSFLGNDIYGMWITVSSIVSWISVGDFGIGNGLRNEISKRYAQRQIQGIRNAVYSTHILFTIISIVSFFLIIVAGRFLILFNIVTDDYYLPLLIMSVFFSIGLFLGRAQTVAIGIQKSWYASLANAIGVSISIAFYAVMIVYQFKPSIMQCAYVYGFVTLIPQFVIIILLKTKSHLFTSDAHAKFDKVLVKQVLKSGSLFFILQLTSLVLFSTDNVLVDYLFGTAEVTNYSIINQIYTVGSSLFLIVINSFWSGVTIHYAQNDIKWIVKCIRNLLFVLMLFSLAVVVVSMLLNQIVYVWIGDSATHYGFDIVIIFALYCVFDCLQSIFSYFNYGIGNTKMIMWLGIASALVNLPLSLLFAKYMNMGIAGIKLGTLTSLLPSWICIIIVTNNLLKIRLSDSSNEDISVSN